MHKNIFFLSSKYNCVHRAINHSVSCDYVSKDVSPIFWQSKWLCQIYRKYVDLAKSSWLDKLYIWRGTVKTWISWSQKHTKVNLQLQTKNMRQSKEIKQKGHRERKYLILHNIWPLLPVFYFWEGDWAMGSVTTDKSEVVSNISFFSKVWKLLRQLIM